MSPLYAWERSTWDSHPFRAFPLSTPSHLPASLVASSSALSLCALPVASFNPLLFCLYPCPPSVIISMAQVPVLFLSLFLPPLLSHVLTRVYVDRAYREPETKFSATSPPSMLPITRCSRDEIERPRRFSAPAATILQWMWKDKIEQVRRKREREA